MVWSRSLRSFLAFCLLMIHASFADAADPVKLSVYFESLSLECQTFYTDQLYPVWSDLKDIMTMDINFYGKTVETPTEEGYDFFCQNGPSECQGNMMMVCAKDIWMQDRYIEFGNCIMGAFISVSAGQVCANYIGEDYTPVEDCWTSVRGQQLLHETGEKQKSLDPVVSYVPWIIINDVFSQEILDEAQKDLRKVICDAYEGIKPLKCYPSLLSEITI